MKSTSTATTVNNDIGAAIVKGACNPEAKDVVVEVGEIAFDSLLEEGLLKEIPVLKTVLACRKTWEAIHDQLFLRKVAGFFQGCPRFSEAEKTRFMDEHLRDQRAAKHLGDAIVLILDRLDDFAKPAMLAKVFAAYVRGHIDYPSFRRIATGVATAFTGDLQTLVAQPAPPELRSDKFLAVLEPAGFASTGGGMSRHGVVGTQTNVSAVGKLFQRCIWDHWPAPQAEANRTP